MRKLFLFIALSTSLYFIGCSGGKSDETVSATPGLQQAQIKVNGNTLNFWVPDSTFGKLEITEQSWGATEIKVGKDFQISIAENEGDIALTKSDVEGNDVNKFKRYVVNEPNLLFWESQITEPEFHFYLVQKVGLISYVVEDIKGDSFSEKSAQAMVDAGKSIKATVADKPNS